MERPTLNSHIGIRGMQSFRDKLYARKRKITKAITDLVAGRSGLVELEVYWPPDSAGTIYFLGYHNGEEVANWDFQLSKRDWMAVTISDPSIETPNTVFGDLKHVLRAVWKEISAQISVQTVLVLRIHDDVGAINLRNGRAFDSTKEQPQKTSSAKEVAVYDHFRIGSNWDEVVAHFVRNSREVLPAGFENDGFVSSDRKGVTLFCENGVLARVHYFAPFKGSVRRIQIGDTAEKVRMVLGEPDVQGLWDKLFVNKKRMYARMVFVNTGMTLSFDKSNRVGLIAIG